MIHPQRWDRGEYVVKSVLRFQVRVMSLDRGQAVRKSLGFGSSEPHRSHVVQFEDASEGAERSLSFFDSANGSLAVISNKRWPCSSNEHCCSWSNQPNGTLALPVSHAVIPHRFHGRRPNAHRRRRIPGLGV